MRKVVIISLFVSQAIVAQNNVQIPFFDKIPSKQLSGLSSYFPSNGSAGKVVDPLYYKKNEDVLGRYMDYENDIFNNVGCDYYVPDSEVDLQSDVQIDGTISAEKKNMFDAEITADLKKLLETSIDLPDSLKVKLAIEIEKTVKKETSSSIKLNFKILQLNTRATDNIKKKCLIYAKGLNDLKLKEVYIITGISVISTKGEFYSKILKDSMSEFEFAIGLEKYLNADLLAKYERSKTTALNGTFQPINLVVAYSYRTVKIN